jgi:hypothetical protein
MNTGRMLFKDNGEARLKFGYSENLVKVGVLNNTVLRDENYRTIGYPTGFYWTSEKFAKDVILDNNSIKLLSEG